VKAPVVRLSVDVGWLQKQRVLPEAGKRPKRQSRAGKRFTRCMTNTLPATCDRITYSTYPPLYINEA